MGHVAIVTDSSCDLPPALVDELGIRIVPLTVRFGTTELVDRVDLDPKGFWARCAESPVLPETAAPSPGAFDAAYRAALDGGADAVVAITISGELSATYQAAALAAANAPELPVQVVDSRSVSMGLGMIVVDAARRGATGASADEVAAGAVDAAGRTRVYAALDTLENLRKGGRIGGAKALLGSVLSIKPIIEVVDGKVEEAGKQRTRARALAHLAERVRAAGPVQDLAVMHAECPDVDRVVADLQPLSDTPIIVGEIGAVIGAHAGMGTIGVVFRTP
jgi:DegV family protein with EDD domain